MVYITQQVVKDMFMSSELIKVKIKKKERFYLEILRKEKPSSFFFFLSLLLK